ncbi:MAG: nitroreductase family protein [Deferrisomatales bacterium]|nr:nitroreductase family protein [Deferrisomatales bacterium]
MTYDAFLELVKARRSVRRYKPDPVADEDIEKIVEAARWAPSGFNSQLWEFVVVRKPELRRQIGSIIGEARQRLFKGKAPTPNSENGPPQKIDVGWQEAPVFMLVFGDTRVRPLSHVPPVRTDDEKWTAVFYASLAVAFQHAALAAVSLGLGSQWMSAVQVPDVEAKIKDMLGVPEPLKIFDMLVLGYPEAMPPEKKMRPTKELIHFDDCGVDDFRTDEQVSMYFNNK